MNNMNTSKIIACGATLLLSSCGIYTSYEPQTSVPENLYDSLAGFLYRPLFAGAD